ncbi:MAG TPA: glycosyltransferase [Chloroflexi bacterium]|nr:glycosyltransferase [Chloroflexota bacterium]
MQNSNVPQESLTCSVIVPVYNGVAVITRCLDALAQQTLPAHQYEIIVVDDGSTDATAESVQTWRQTHPQVNLTLVHQANAGPAAARNRGATEAHAPLLLFTDADCAPTPTWLEAMVAPFTDAEVAGAKGAYITAQTGLIPRFVQAEYEDRYDRMCGQPQIDFIDTYSAAYRRGVFLDNHGFDPIFTTASVEDQEFSFRLAQKGYRLVFAPAAKVAHLHDSDLGEYFRRKYYIGFWKALMIRWHPERMVQDSHTPQVLKVQIVVLAAIFGLMMLALFGLVWPPLQWAWFGVGAGALLFLATTLPFVAKLARRSPALALIGPGMLVVRALALGSGYLTGTVHFAGTLPGTHQPVLTGWQRLIKRTIDIVGALLGLLVSIPLVAVAALAIKLDSPGPVFFWQVRVGENGRPFRIVKLRTMVVDAEAKLDNLVDLDALPEPAFKLKHDPRVTRVGRLLRRTSLDEAPQFYNVLRGDMSLVGPRPEEMRIVQLYRDDQRRRLAVKPGMTGPMQISGRGDLSFAERLQLELDYIEHYSLRRDLEILLRTIPAILHGNGAH